MIRINRRAFCHTTAFFVSVFAGSILSGLGAGFGLQAFFRLHYGKGPAPYLYPIVVIAALLGAVFLIIYIFRKIPISCPECGGPSFISRDDEIGYVCAENHSFKPMTFELPQRVKKAANTLTFIILAPIIALMLTAMLIVGGPIIFGMFFAAYFMIGPLLQLLVRLVPQSHPSNQPTAWGQYFGIAFTMLLRTGAVLAIFRFLPVAASGIKFAGGGHAMFNPFFDYLFGGCGIIYAIFTFIREGFWHLLQVFAVRDLPRATVVSASIGLAELSGVVRHYDNRDGSIDPERTIMSFYWKMPGTEMRYGGEGKMLGSYSKDIQPFYLDDGTGTVLVDPVHNGVELRRPFIDALTTFFGRRSFEILLTRHVRKQSFTERFYELREGDPVYVIGNVEMKESVPADVVDSGRLVVRPREQARKGLESLLQFLIPFGKKPARTVHDIFIIADTDEKKAKRLLTRNFIFSTGVSLLLALISVVLILAAGR